MSEYVDLFGMFHALCDNPDATPRRIEHARQSLSLAMGYVWGMEDNGMPAVTSAYGREVNAYWEFAYMYAITDLLYRMERIYSMPSVRHAWQSFRAGIDLREYAS
jgi:hypothetical protein